jgi:hypothetical protein
LAAAGGDGILEIDSNPNPLRAGLAMPYPQLEAGFVVLSIAPGLGVMRAPRWNATPCRESWRSCGAT